MRLKPVFFLLTVVSIFVSYLVIQRLKKRPSSNRDGGSESAPDDTRSGTAGKSGDGGPLSVVEEPEPVAEKTPIQTSISPDVRSINPDLKEKPHEVAETSNRKVVPPPPTQPESGRVAPENRGGGPRGPRASSRKPKERKTFPSLVPEIICWNWEREWIPALEVSHELAEHHDLRVFQNSLPLKQDEHEDNCWPLNGVNGQIIINWNEGGSRKETQIVLDHRQYLLFKLSSKNRGRLVKAPTSGAYLAITPESWQRDELESGPPPVTPEHVSLEEYRAHFFYINGNENAKIAFLADGDKQIIDRKQASFELVGTRLKDATEDKGPLFGVTPPQIQRLDKQDWRDVGTIVIGEEGGGRHKWRNAFEPSQDRKTQDLPQEITREIAKRKAGWYFLRFYDVDDDLIESLDFRFIRDLKNIYVPTSSPIPTDVGHKPVPVEFVHEPGLTIRPAIGSTQSIQIESKDGKITVMIPPDPVYDETRWLVECEGGAKVEVTTLVERLWWAVSEVDKEPSQWQCQILTLRLSDLKATSNKALWIRLPRRRWIDKIFVGFKQQNARPYSVKAQEQTVSIPLYEFGNAQEMQKPGMVPLNLWVLSQGKTLTTAVCELVVKLACKSEECGFMADAEQAMLDHVASLHLDELFRDLKYEEMRNRIPRLPKDIYLCKYCSFYVTSDDNPWPTTVMLRHVTRQCPGVPHSAIRPTPVEFQTVNNIHTIPKELLDRLLLHRLPHVSKCQVCEVLVEPASQSNMIQHVIEVHRSIIYDLV